MDFLLNKIRILWGIFFSFTGLFILFYPSFHIVGYVFTKKIVLDPTVAFVGFLTLFFGLFLIYIGFRKKQKTVKQIIKEALYDASEYY